MESEKSWLTGGARQLRRAAAATSRGVLILGAGHQEVRQRAWDIVSKVLGEFRFGDQGVLLKKAVRDEEFAPKADYLKQ